MFDVKPFDFASDYGVYKSWLAMRGRPVPYQDSLSPNGFMVLCDSREVAAGFVFPAGARECVFGNFASNPLEKRDVRDDALETLIDFMTNWARANNFRSITVTSNKTNFVNRFLKRGFRVNDTGLMQLTGGV